MKTQANKTAYKRIALALSLCALILWGILGTGASLAWFTDTSPEINNIFHFAEFDLVVSHRLTDGKWQEVDSQTKIFDEEALYEPGYVQVVYLKVENKGTVPFEFSTAVNVNGCIEATNVFGQRFMLQDYLKFGLTTANTEEEMGLAMLGSVLGSGIAEIVIDKKLFVDNYFVCSIGRIVFEGEEKIVSVGCFNHVFTMPEDKLKEELKNSF